MFFSQNEDAFENEDYLFIFYFVLRNDFDKKSEDCSVCSDKMPDNLTM